MPLHRHEHRQIKNRQIAVSKPLAAKERNLANPAKILAILPPQPSPLRVLANVTRKGRELALLLHNPIMPIPLEDRGDGGGRGRPRKTLASRTLFCGAGQFCGAGPVRHHPVLRHHPAGLVRRHPGLPRHSPVFHRQRLHQLVNVAPQRHLIARILDANEQVNVIGHDHKAIYRPKPPPLRGEFANHPRECLCDFIFNKAALPPLRVLRCRPVLRRRPRPVPPLRLRLIRNLREGRQLRQPLQRHHIKKWPLVVKSSQTMHGTPFTLLPPILRDTAYCSLATS